MMSRAQAATFRRSDVIRLLILLLEAGASPSLLPQDVLRRALLATPNTRLRRSCKRYYFICFIQILHSFLSFTEKRGCMLFFPNFHFEKTQTISYFSKKRKYRNKSKYKIEKKCSIIKYLCILNTFIYMLNLSTLCLLIFILNVYILIINKIMLLCPYFHVVRSVYFKV